MFDWLFPKTVVKVTIYPNGSMQIQRGRNVSNIHAQDDQAIVDAVLLVNPDEIDCRKSSVQRLLKKWYQ